MRPRLMPASFDMMSIVLFDRHGAPASYIFPIEVNYIIGIRYHIYQCGHAAWGAPPGVDAS